MEMNMNNEKVEPSWSHIDGLFSNLTGNQCKVWTHVKCMSNLYEVCMLNLREMGRALKMHHLTVKSSLTYLQEIGLLTMVGPFRNGRDYYYKIFDCSSDFFHKFDLERKQRNREYVDMIRKFPF